MIQAIAICHFKETEGACANENEGFTLVIMQYNISQTQAIHQSKLLYLYRLIVPYHTSSFHSVLGKLREGLSLPVYNISSKCKFKIR